MLFVCNQCLKGIETHEGHQNAKHLAETEDHICEWCGEINAEYILINDIDTHNKGYFGVVRWCDEDIIEAFKNHGVECPSLEDIKRVRDSVQTNLENRMVEAGWEVINSYVWDFLYTDN